MKITPKIYEPEIITPFQPLQINTRKYTKAFFQKDFPDMNPEKGNVLYKFASITECNNKHIFANYHIDLLNLFSLKKLNSIYPIAKLKDFSNLVRFSPEELLRILNLKTSEIEFIKPFARQKNYKNIFNFSTNQLLTINNHSQAEKERFVNLLSTHLDYNNMETLVKDKDVDVVDFSGAVREIQEKYAENIHDISIFKADGKYNIKITTQEPFKTQIFPYIKGKRGIKMTPQRFNSIEKINNEIEKIKSLNCALNKHNFEAINFQNGKIKNYTFSLQPNLIRKEWEAGNLTKEDITDIFTNAAGIISEEDFNYFAKNGFKLTYFDNEKVIQARQHFQNCKPVDANSKYYKEKESEILSKEFAKLKGIAAERKLLILDGLPGAGKSTVYRKFVKDTSFYTTDNDDIKKEFVEVYNNGIGSQLVHNAAKRIYKGEILPKAFSEGKNIVYQTCGGYESLNKIIEKAHKNGYEIEYVNVNTSTNISIRHALSRQETDGRFMDPYLILQIARRNASAKHYMAKIISYNPNINSAYEYNKGILSKIENGTEVTNVDLNKTNFIDKIQILWSKFLQIW